MRVSKLFFARLFSPHRLFILLVYTFFFSVVFLSCRQDYVEKKVIYSDNVDVYTFKQLFEVFWQGMSDRYVYWDQEKVNWDEVYKEYSPKFARLDSLSGQKANVSDSAYQYVLNMLKDLKDPGIGIATSQSTSATLKLDGETLKNISLIYPKGYRYSKLYQKLPDTLFDYLIKDRYVNKFDYGIVNENSLGSITQVTSGFIKPELTSKKIAFAGINFGLTLREGYNQGFGIRPIRPVLSNLFNALKTQDAFILDLRNCQGGNVEDVNFFAGWFTQAPVTFGYARSKASLSRFDYTPWIPMTLLPQAGGIDYQKTIVILTNRFTSYTAEILVQAFRALPHAKVALVGETTYGTSGTYIGTTETMNAGTFNVSSYININMFNMAITDANRQFYLEGIKPDVEVVLTKDQVTQLKKTGVDTQLEAAIQYLNTH